MIRVRYQKKTQTCRGGQKKQTKSDFCSKNLTKKVRIFAKFDRFIAKTLKKIAKM